MGRRWIALSVGVFVVGLVVVFGRLLLDFDGYVHDLETRRFARVSDGETDAPWRPTLRQDDANALALRIHNEGIVLVDAVQVWTLWDLRSDEGAERFARNIRAMADEDGWVAAFVVWLNDSRIEQLYEAEVGEVRERAEPILDELSASHRRVIRHAWQEHGYALLGSSVELVRRVAHIGTDEVLDALEDRVRSSLRGELLPLAATMSDWIHLTESETDCVLRYEPSADHISATLRADCVGGEEETRVIALPRF